MNARETRRLRWSRHVVDALGQRAVRAARDTSGWESRDIEPASRGARGSPPRRRAMARRAPRARRARRAPRARRHRRRRAARLDAGQRPQRPGASSASGPAQRGVAGRRAPARRQRCGDPRRSGRAATGRRGCQCQTGAALGAQARGSIAAPQLVEPGAGSRAVDRDDFRSRAPGSARRGHRAPRRRPSSTMVSADHAARAELLALQEQIRRGGRATWGRVDADDHRVRASGAPSRPIRRVERDLLLGAARVDRVRAGQVAQIGDPAVGQGQRAGRGLDGDARVVSRPSPTSRSAR